MEDRLELVVVLAGDVLLLVDDDSRDAHLLTAADDTPLLLVDPEPFLVDDLLDQREEFPRAPAERPGPENVRSSA